jgi:hypothetical protein
VERKKAQSFMLFEEDVIFHQDTAALLSQIRVPLDWQFIYVGGRNCGNSEFVSPGLVKSDFVADLHAVIIRSSMIDRLRKVLMDCCINSSSPDFRFATLQNRFPAYLCRPNLAWKAPRWDPSGNGLDYSLYNDDGSVKFGMGN